MMLAEMNEIQPLMHLLSKYVIKPISFEANPYVLPRAAQFVKYGGANKYFQKHGNTKYHDGPLVTPQREAAPKKDESVLVRRP